MKMIKWIIWTASDIGDEGAKMISESLKINATLTKLDLHNDEIEINEKKQKSKGKYKMEWEKEYKRKNV